MSALAGPLTGGLIDRLGPRRVLPLGAALLALGTALCALIQELWQFYLCYGVIAGLGLAATGWVPNNAVLSRWFVRRLGAAAGTASTGVGAGIFFVVPQIHVVVELLGWRAGFLLLAGLVGVVLIPLNLLFQRASPRELGLEPDGGAAPAQRGRGPSRRRVVVDPAWANRLWTLGAAVRTRRFWLLFAGLGAASFAQQLLVVHQVAYLVDAGRPRDLAAAAAGLYGAFAIPAKIIWGSASDRYGREVAFAVGTVAYVMAFPTLEVVARGGDPLWLLLYALLVGIGFGTIGPIAPGMVADLFTGPSYGLIFGAIAIATGAGGALGAWFAGWIFDVTRQYQAAFASAIAAAAFAIIACWLAAPRKVRAVKRL